MASCILHLTVGGQERCPEEACALWADGCAIEQLKLDLGGRADLAAYLLELRQRLEQLRGA